MRKFLFQFRFLQSVQNFAMNNKLLKTISSNSQIKEVFFQFSLSGMLKITESVVYITIYILFIYTFTRIHLRKTRIIYYRTVNKSKFCDR